MDQRVKPFKDIDDLSKLDFFVEKTRHQEMHEIFATFMVRMPDVTPASYLDQLRHELLNFQGMKITPAVEHRLREIDYAWRKIEPDDARYYADWKRGAEWIAHVYSYLKSFEQP